MLIVDAQSVVSNMINGSVHNSNSPSKYFGNQPSMLEGDNISNYTQILPSTGSNSNIVGLKQIKKSVTKSHQVSEVDLNEV